jgi:GT2 family glycosyltransferase
MIEIVAATRAPEAQFWNASALGVSLRRLGNEREIAPHIAFDNQRGLPLVFNGRIAARQGADILVFMHDDVWIDDYFLVDRLAAALESFDVVGLAGNRRRVPGQVGWAFKDDKFTRDDAQNLSGAVAHGPQAFGTVVHYGRVPAPCELLDGLFLAAKRSVLAAKGVLFDPRFDFHFYDLDFCRTARTNGLRLGTWPICVTHQSSGAANARMWTENHRRYLEKWGS